MLKFLFWILLAANTVLFAFQVTYFDAPASGKREPERLTYQHQQDQILLLSSDEINRAITKAKAAGQSIAKANTAGQSKTVTGSCVDVGNFSKTEAVGFEGRLRSLSLKPEDIHAIAIQEGSTYMVFVPPAAGQKAAEAKIAELKQKGIKSHFLIKNQTKMQWAISLGIFKTREAAASYAAELEKTGIPNLQIAPHGAATEKLVYRLENLDEKQLKSLESAMNSLPHQSLRHCQPTSEKPT